MSPKPREPGKFTHTVASLKNLLKLANIEIPKKSKLADLRILCEQNKLVALQPPDMKSSKKICIVKCALKSAMALNEKDFEAFSGDVEKFVRIVSMMMRRASLALSFHMTKLAAADEPIPDFYDNDKVKDTFWKNWLKIGIDDVYPDTASKISYLKIEHVLGKIIDKNSNSLAIYAKEYPMHFDQILGYAGHTLKTVVTNNAWVPLFNRLARLTKKTLKALKVDKSITTYKVMSVIRSEIQEMQDWPEPLQKYVSEVRMRLEAGAGERLYDKYGYEEVTFGVMFKFNYWMQTRFEALEVKRMKLMPIFGVGRVHVRLDTRTLMAIANKILPENKLRTEIALLTKTKAARDPELYMFEDHKRPATLKKKNCVNIEDWEAYKLRLQDYEQKVNVTKESNEYKEQKARFEHLQKLQNQIVSDLFQTKYITMKLRQGYVFDSSIQTDGVSISLQFSKSVMVPTFKKNGKKIISQPDDEVVESLEYDRDLSTLLPDKKTIVIGNDPGRNNLAFVTYFDSQNSKSWSLTRGAYYADSGINKLNQEKNIRFQGIASKWIKLGGEGIGLSTSKASDIEAYLKEYSKFYEDWWTLALNRRESRYNLQRYSGKRSVMDTFYSKIKKDLTKLFPGTSIDVAYGSAVNTMPSTGKGEVAAPVGGMFAACKRVFKGNDRVSVTDEFRSTMIGWKHGTKKEHVYKTFRKTPTGIKETLHHTTNNKMPVVKDCDVKMVEAYNERKQHQGKKRRGGGSFTKSLTGDEPVFKEKERKLRYPEVRGLRFLPEVSMYFDRDREAALTIGRLHCMELLGEQRPYPFNRKCKL
jgi:hypothetical protein